MNLYFRVIWAFIVTRFRKPCPVLGPCITPFCTWPTDLDLYMHMNNGRYLTILDLARYDLMARSGILAKLFKMGWFPILTAETILFKKPLKCFDRFTVETKVLGWGEKEFLVQQEFFCKQQLTATAIIQVRFLKKSGGSVLPEEIMALVDYKDPSPILPDWVARWHDDQTALRNAGQ